MAAIASPAAPPTPRAVLAAANRLGVRGPATAGAIADHLGVEADDLAEPLASLASSGRVAVWPDPDGSLRVAAILSDREVDRAARHRRRPTGAALATEIGIELHWIADGRAPSPDAGAIEGEDWTARSAKAPRKRDGAFTAGTKPPRPRRFVGLDVAWVSEPPEGPCEGCDGKHLDALTICLYCGRWGLDGKVEQARPIPPRESAKLAGGVGEAAPKGRVDSSAKVEPRRSTRRRKAPPAARETRNERFARLLALAEGRAKGAG